MSLIITQEVNSVSITVSYGGGGVVGDSNYDGGNANSIYLTSQTLDGGNA